MQPAGTTAHFKKLLEHRNDGAVIDGGRKVDEIRVRLAVVVVVRVRRPICEVGGGDWNANERELNARRAEERFKLRLAEILGHHVGGRLRHRCTEAEHLLKGPL